MSINSQEQCLVFFVSRQAADRKNIMNGHPSRTLLDTGVCGYASAFVTQCNAASRNSYENGEGRVAQMCLENNRGRRHADEIHSLITVCIQSLKVRHQVHGRGSKDCHDLRGHEDRDFGVEPLIHFSSFQG